MFTKNWALMAFSCIFTSSPVRGENVQRDDNAGLEPRAVFDGPPPSTAICEIATALCAACPPSVTTQPPITITSTATVTFSNCFVPMATVTVTSCPFDTVTRTVTECISIPSTTTTTTTTTPRPVSSSATPTPSSSIRPSSLSVRPSSTPLTIRSSTPLSSGFSSTIPPRTTVSTSSHITTTVETARATTTLRGPPGIVRREMMGNNITALVTNTTRTSTNATASLALNLTGITTTTTTTTGVFPRFHRVRYRN